MTTQAGLSHKERLLRSGIELFYANGYNGTAVDGLLADATVPKGSFYHHFGSKQAFGFAVLDQYDATQARVLDRWVQRTDLTVPERLAGYHEEFISRFVASDWRRACLVGKLSNELSASSEEYRTRLAASFAAWKLQIANMLEDGQSRGEVRSDEPASGMADAVLAMIQGAFVTALVLHDLDYLTAVTKSLVDLVAVQA